uniref:Glutaredoxin domain-containing protein n=1 Tax=Romanomermis culicivorax TaxID=13658 RepID=A0A915L255_ROMCU
MLFENYVPLTVCVAITLLNVAENQEIINDPQNLHQPYDARQFKNFETDRSLDPRLLKMLASTGPAFSPIVDEDTTLEPQGAPRPPINVQEANYMSAVASLPQRGGLLGVAPPVLNNAKQYSNVESQTQIFDGNLESRSGQRALHLDGMQKEAMIKDMMLRAIQQNQGRFVSPRYPPINGQNFPNLLQQGPMMTNFPRYVQNMGGTLPGQMSPIFNSPRQYQLADQVDRGCSPDCYNQSVKKDVSLSPIQKRSRRLSPTKITIYISNIVFQGSFSFSPMPFNSNSNNAWEAENALLQWKNGQNYQSSAPSAWNIGANKGAMNGVVAFSAPSTENVDQKEKNLTANQQPVNVSIVAFTKSSCGQNCVELEKIFKNYHNLSADIFEVEKMPLDGQEALLSLYQRSGIRVMPQVYICNKFVGGIDKIRHLQKTKKLDDIVKRCS